MYHTDCETLKARKPHRCMSCGEAIAVGETYKRWRTYDGGYAGTNKMHPECLAMHQADAARFGENAWEYSTYGHERPKPEDRACTCHPDPSTRYCTMNCGPHREPTSVAPRLDGRVKPL